MTVQFASYSFDKNQVTSTNTEEFNNGFLAVVNFTQKVGREMGKVTAAKWFRTEGEAELALKF